MKTIDASVIEKFEPNVGVSGTQFMSEDLQANFAKNTAFSGYMWVPCFCRGVKSSGSGPFWFDVILPKAEVDIMVAGFTDDAVPTAHSFDLYQGDAKLTDQISFTLGNYFYETAYISRISANTDSYRLKVWALTGDVYPFTMFYRIVR